MLQLDLEGVTDTQPSYRAQTVQSLADFRHEWQESTDEKSLIEVDSPVGLLLADIADRLGFGPQERYVVLGSELVKEINSFMEERVQVKVLPEQLYGVIPSMIPPK